MNGFLLIDKPAGISSNQALNVLKQKTKIKKIGHTGTLDPFATGLLVVSVGEASKVIPYLKEEPKIYEATLKLGEATDTLDRTGRVVDSKAVPDLTEETIIRTFQGFLGKQGQVPPMFSAKKRGGEKLYKLARKGIEVDRKPVEIEIFDLSAVGAPFMAPSKSGVMNHAPAILFRVSCSRGTYVRVLGADMAGAIGTVGHLTELRRIRAGDFRVEEAVDPESDFGLEERLVPMMEALNHLPFVDLSAAEAAKIRQGQPVTAVNPGNGIVVLKSGNDFLGIGEFRGGELWPKRLIQ